MLQMIIDYFVIDDAKLPDIFWGIGHITACSISYTEIYRTKFPHCPENLAPIILAPEVFIHISRYIILFGSRA